MTKPYYLRGVKFLPCGIDDALDEIIKFIPKMNGDYFCFANIHVVMESRKDPELKRVLNQSAANFPDGMGTAGALKVLGNRFKERVRGVDLMLRLCSYASQNGMRVFLYGNTEETLIALRRRLNVLFPGIPIVGAVSPPFRELTQVEDKLIINRINRSNPDILFISLGAPKQEKWMAIHKGEIKAIQLGVGAAFDFIAGNIKQAPKWMQKTYLEWLHRLPQQPKKTVIRMAMLPEFLILLLEQYISERILGQDQKKHNK